MEGVFQAKAQKLRRGKEKRKNRKQNNKPPHNNTNNNKSNAELEEKVCFEPNK